MDYRRCGRFRVNLNVAVPRADDIIENKFRFSRRHMRPVHTRSILINGAALALGLNPFPLTKSRTRGKYDGYDRWEGLGTGFAV